MPVHYNLPAFILIPLLLVFLLFSLSFCILFVFLVFPLPFCIFVLCSDPRRLISRTRSALDLIDSTQSAAVPDLCSFCHLELIGCHRHCSASAGPRHRGKLAYHAEHYILPPTAPPPLIPLSPRQLPPRLWQRFCPHLQSNCWNRLLIKAPKYDA